ncbi:MAG: 1-deoxy-D-xylulose-5-phosphate reductoisomerase [Oscillospiraceae bacterium]|jgi:1-deoxy-D-xylulose-5-phosphate reductoisomerase
MKKISILGSTGSIGTQALETAKAHNIKIQALSAYSNVDLLEKQALEFCPTHICIADGKRYAELKLRLGGKGIKLLSGEEGLCEIAEMADIDIMLNAVVGIAGLLPTVKAIESKTDIALANKETLVAGGELVMKLAKEKGVNIFPVDSEHSAIFQCLQGNNKGQLKKIILTASGGPFFGKTKSELEQVKIEQALCHPNWSMGRKITVDSATLMNKGLEFIEAVRLFNVKPEQIEIVVHRESVIHSAVEYDDYSVIAQLGVPDMKIPIQYALLYPERKPCPTKRLSLTDYGRLTFFKPDFETFDCLSACIRAAEVGKTAPAAVNGANEEAVKHFLDGKISFLQIGELVTKSLDHVKAREADTLKAVFDADRAAREFVLENIDKR